MDFILFSMVWNYIEFLECISYLIPELIELGFDIYEISESIAPSDVFLELHLLICLLSLILLILVSFSLPG